MKQGLTEIAFVIDKSGSMAGLEDDIVGGFNSFINEQKSLPDEARVTVVTFNQDVRVNKDNEPIDQIQPLKRVDYWPQGTTALLDAIGFTIDGVGERLSNTPDDERPSKVIVVIMTDGEENASREYSLKKIKEMIKHQTNVYSWEFVFLGANIDAFTTAESFGISASNSANFVATHDGVMTAMACATKAVSNARLGTDIGADWAESLLAESVSHSNV